jgi:protein-tyrosine kinase
VDRIRKALDLARQEREQSVGAALTETAPPPNASIADVAEFRTPDAANASAQEVRNGPRVFSPPASILEKNKILDPSSSAGAVAAFRMLRTQVLQRIDANGWRTMAIFSPSAEDGKTTTAANLALSLAGDHLHTVLLVELDFKRPSLAARFGFAPTTGADDVIAGEARIQDCLYQPQGLGRLVLMPARATLLNSSELLAGPRCRAMVSELRARYSNRIVLFDLPPVLAADDALSFAPLIDCGLVVAAEGRTRRKDLVRTVELLHKTPLVGTVLNRAADTPPGY